MTLRNKLTLLLVALLVFGLGLTGVTWWALRQWHRGERELHEHYLRSVLLQDLRAMTFRAFIELPEAISGADPDAEEEFESLLQPSLQDFAEWEQLALTAAERSDLLAVRTAWERLVADARVFFDLVEQGRAREAAELLENRLEYEGFARFEQVSSAAVAADEAYRRELQSRIQRSREVAQAAQAAATVAAVFLVAVLAYQLFAAFFPALRRVESALNALGKGNLDHRLPEDQRRGVEGRDEIAALVQAFNRTVSALSVTTVSKSYLDQIIQNMGEALLVTDTDEVVRTLNPAAVGLLAPRDDALGSPMARLFPGLPDFSGTTSAKTEYSLNRPDGANVRLLISRSPMLDREQRLAGAIYMAQDISALKNVESELRRSLEEKEVLFKELNHRVKNTLQVISSLLNLQARQTVDEAARSALGESRNRVQAMVLLHEKLNRSTAPDRVELAEYVGHLMQTLADVYGASARGIRLDLTSVPVVLELDRAIPAGLIINELVTNALKHGFPHQGGTIHIRLEKVGGDLRLAVRDNGVGLPEHLLIEETRSLGLRLVRSFTQQLGGRLGVGSGPGAEFVVEFPSTERT